MFILFLRKCISFFFPPNFFWKPFFFFFFAVLLNFFSKSGLKQNFFQVVLLKPRKCLKQLQRRPEPLPCDGSERRSEVFTEAGFVLLGRHGVG